MRVAAPAKVNLHLGVHPKLDERGYHRVDSLMAAVDVCDWLAIEVADGETHIWCDPEPGVGERDNTAYRAWEELRRRVDDVPHLRIHVEKQIPVQAGLGGDSSDAGAVLRVLCEMLGLDAGDERVQAAARATGADVAFFLDPRPTLLSGAGDVPVRTLECSGEFWVVLARAAGAGVSTKEAYAWFDRDPADPGDPSAMCEALESGDVRAVGDALSNNLAEVACALSPQVADVLEALSACEEAVGSTVCGSGSCCFALFETEEAAARCAGELADEHPDWWVRAARMWRSWDEAPTRA